MKGENHNTRELRNVAESSTSAATLGESVASLPAAAAATKKAGP